VVQGYQFALDPTPKQEAMLRSHCGAQRYAFNWGLARVKANLGQREAEKSYGLPTDDLTPALSWSAWSLRKTWNQAKTGVAPWWAENSKEAYAAGLANLAAGLQNWKDSRSGKRKGPKARFPRFKGKRAGLSCQFTTGAFGLAGAGRRHVQLPRIGVIRTHESTANSPAASTPGRPGSARRSSRSAGAGGWCRSRHRSPAPTPRPPGPVRSLASISASSPSLCFRPGRWCRTRGTWKWHSGTCGACSGRRRAVTGRTGGLGPCRQRGGARPKPASRLHPQVACARRDGLHKLSARLTSVYGTVVVEDLNVAGMMSNRRLARHIAGVGMGEFRRQVGYKAAWRGGRAAVADRWFPSSKMCSGCGAVKAKLRLSERTFTCGQCGLVLDRDLNAALNLAALVSSRSWRATQNEPSGNLCKTSTVLAAGTATGRPPRSTPCREATAHDTLSHVS
jgi:putative transposase